MKLHKFVSVLLLTMLFLALTGNFQSFNVEIKLAHGSPNMFPSDGDAWTENNNATYPWTCSPSYPDDIQFVSEDKKVGSYSLRVNHTSATTFMAFSLDIRSETNVSSYDIFIFWFKLVRGTWTEYATIDFRQAGRFTGNKYAWTYHVTENVWCKAVIPLDAFIETGSPSWTDRRYICFQINGVSSSDGTKVYIDGIHFANWDTVSEASNSVDETMMPNFDSFIHRWEKTQTYKGKNYTSLYSMVPVGGSSFSYESLESETLGQTVYGLCLAYNCSQMQYYLDLAETYVDWLLNFEYKNSSSQGNGGFYRQYLGSDTWDTWLSNTYNGWILAGLSYYYYFTSSSTVKDACDSIRGFLIDCLWDDANDWFDSYFKTDTQTVDDSAYWKGMPQGACATGLSLYYKYISLNSTVKSVLDQQLTKGLTQPQRNHFCFGSDAYEDSMYAYWGAYWASKAFSNSTYYNKFLLVPKLMRANYMIVNDGSQFYDNYCIHNATSDAFDGWGFACGLPLLYLAYEETEEQNYLKLFEKQMRDLIPSIQTGNYSITRKRNSADTWVNWQYLPSNAFMLGALCAYYNQIYKPTNPYLISTTEEIASSTYANAKLTFTVNNKFGALTSTTRVYCGEKGEPSIVYGAGSWSYNASTTISTLNVTHLSPARIVVYWRFPSDIDGDGDVDADDFYIFAGAYGTTDGDPTYNPDADLDGDGDIDPDDFYIFAKDYGKTVCIHAQRTKNDDT